MPDFKLSKEIAEWHLQPTAQKTDLVFGKMIAEKLLEKVMNGQDAYFNTRNQRMERNRKFARGHQDMREFLDLLNIDGKESYVNLNMKAPPIAPKFVNIMVQRFMERIERPTVTAIDDKSKKSKQRRKDEAEFRMMMGGEINELQEQGGMQLEDPTAFVPEDRDDLELHFELEDRSPDEVSYETGIFNVWEDSNYEVFKRKTLNDIIKDGFAVAKVYLDENKRIKIRSCQTASVIYGYSQMDDFSDCTFVGELQKMKISEARAKYSIAEDKLFKFYEASRQGSTIDNIRWTDDFNTCAYRPYDDAVVEILDFEFITSDPKVWIKATDARGRMKMTSADTVPEKLKDNQELMAKNIMVVYQGVYAVGSNEMISWKRADNMIKPHYALHEVLGSYTIIMPENEDMKSMAMVERMENSIVQMTTSLLKMQQLKGALRPDELAIDASMLQAIDLGNGLVQPYELLKMFDQTGKAIFQSETEGGEQSQNIPFQPLQLSSAAQKIQVLMADYNFHLQLLRDMVGFNEASDGTGVGERTGLQVMNNQIGVSNRATDFIYGGFTTFLSNISKRISILLWWNITGGGKNYQSVADAETISDKIYDLSISVLPTDQERQYIEQLVTTALTAGVITFEEAFRIRRLAQTNIKVAEIYLSKYEKKRQAQKLAEAQNNAAANAQQQMASNAQQHQNALQLKQAEGQGKIQLQDLMNQNDRTKQLGEFLKAAMANPETTKAIPPEMLKAATETYLANLLGTQQSQIMGNQTDLQNQQIMQQQANQMMAEETVE